MSPPSIPPAATGRDNLLPDAVAACVATRRRMTPPRQLMASDCHGKAAAPGWSPWDRPCRSSVIRTGCASPESARSVAGEGGDQAVTGTLSRGAGYGRPAPPVRLVHLGLGNFFRAHQAWYTEQVPDADQWGIAAFEGRGSRLAETLAGAGRPLHPGDARRRR